MDSDINAHLGRIMFLLLYMYERNGFDMIRVKAGGCRRRPTILFQIWSLQIWLSHTEYYRDLWFIVYIPITENCGCRCCRKVENSLPQCQLKIYICGH